MCGRFTVDLYRHSNNNCAVLYITPVKFMHQDRLHRSHLLSAGCMKKGLQGVLSAGCRQKTSAGCRQKDRLQGAKKIVGCRMSICRVSCQIDCADEKIVCRVYFGSCDVIR